MTVHDVLYTIYIVLCIIYYSDVLVGKYGPRLLEWWQARNKFTPEPLPHMDERQAAPRALSPISPRTAAQVASRRPVRATTTTTMKSNKF